MVAKKRAHRDEALSLLLTKIIVFYMNMAVMSRSIYSYAKMEKKMGHVNDAIEY